MTASSRTLGPDRVDSTEVLLTVRGMTCGSCAARIQHRLNKLDGVEATVNFASERAQVTVGPDYPVEHLLREIESIGFSADLYKPSEPAGVETDGPDDRTRDLGRRLVVSAVLFMPLCDLSIAFWLIPIMRFPGWQWILMAVAAPVVTWSAWPFYSTTARGLRHGSFTMDTLVSLGIVASSAYSVYSMFFEKQDRTHRSILFLLSHHVGGASYLDVATGVTTFVLAGRYVDEFLDPEIRQGGQDAPEFLWVGMVAHRLNDHP